jgi:hypothetical protein
MESKYESELLSRGTKFEFQSIPECQENTLVVFGRSGGITVEERQQRKDIAVTVGLEPQSLKLGRKICAKERPTFSSRRIWQKVHEI